MSRHIALPCRVVQRLMGRGNVGWMKLRCFRKCLHRRIVAHHKIEHMRQESGIGGGSAQRLRADPGFGQKRAQPFGIACDKGKRLNRNDFSDFSRVPLRFSQDSDLPFAN